jgi:hypothetical protein
MKKWKPLFVENSLVPKTLSKIAPINISAITIGFVVFCAGVPSESTRRHETIHFQQFLETLFVGFLLIYAWDYVRLLCKGRSGKEAYLLLRAEREAYHHDCDPDYLAKRKRYEWITKYKI